MRCRVRMRGVHSDPVLAAPLHIVCRALEQETGELYPASKYLNLYFKIKWFYVKYLGDQCPPDARCPPPDYTRYVLSRRSNVAARRVRIALLLDSTRLDSTRFDLIRFDCSAGPRAQLVRALHLALARPERTHLAAGGALRLRGRPLQRRTLCACPTLFSCASTSASLPVSACLRAIVRTRACAHVLRSSRRARRRCATARRLWTCSRSSTRRST